MIHHDAKSIFLLIRLISKQKTADCLYQGGMFYESKLIRIQMSSCEDSLELTCFGVRVNQLVLV